MHGVLEKVSLMNLAIATWSCHLVSHLCQWHLVAQSTSVSDQCLVWQDEVITLTPPIVFSVYHGPPCLQAGYRMCLQEHMPVELFPVLDLHSKDLTFTCD